MRGVTIRGGVTAATLASGPVFVLAMAVIQAAGWRGQYADYSGLLMLLLISVPFGAIIGAIPNWIGASLMAASGRENVGLRLPVMWVLAGAGAGAAIGGIAGGSDDGSTATAFMALIGAICAGTCRLFTRWDD